VAATEEFALAEYELSGEGPGDVHGAVVTVHLRRDEKRLFFERCARRCGRVDLRLRFLPRCVFGGHTVFLGLRRRGRRTAVNPHDGSEGDRGGLSHRRRPLPPMSATADPSLALRDSEDSRAGNSRGLGRVTRRYRIIAPCMRFGPTAKFSSELLRAQRRRAHGSARIRPAGRMHVRPPRRSARIRSGRSV
jgi:hypothetical protein